MGVAGSLFGMDRRLRKLERERRRRAAFETAEQWQREFSIKVSCPPTTAITIMGGKLWENTGYWFWISYDVRVQDLEVDFADPPACEIYDGAGGDLVTFAFTQTAGGYLAFVLSFNYDWVFWGKDGGAYGDGIFFADGLAAEYASAGEAEAEIDAMFQGTTQLYNWDRFPLAGFVLRNDGRLGVDGAVLPVDPVNRDRSYVYRDARPRNRLTG